LFLLPFSAATLFAAPLVTATSAMAQEFPEISCLINQYNPGATYPEHIIRSWIPESFVIKQKSGGGYKFEGGSFREPKARVEEVVRTGNRVLYKMIANSIDNRGNHVSLRYNIYFFTSNHRVSVETDSVGQYARLGSASGSCATL
jgi:hypothetical protein